MTLTHASVMLSLTGAPLGTLHCILSYLFNTTVLALLINIGASMF